MAGFGVGSMMPRGAGGMGFMRSMMTVLAGLYFFGLMVWVVAGWIVPLLPYILSGIAIITAVAIAIKVYRRW